MARKTKARARAASRKKKPAVRNPKIKKKTKAAGKKSPARKTTGKRGTEVEHQWSAYLKRRTALVQAVETVRVASAELSKARETEAARRKDFDDSKRSLEQLLEVEGAARGGGGRDGRSIDLPLPGQQQTRDKGDARKATQGSLANG